MKVFSVAGYHHTGKTTLVVELIKELRGRGFSVTSVKDIHNENFTMEKKGSNSWKHMQAGSNTVIARGINETYQIWNRQLSLNEMLSHLKSDYVVVEGMKSVAIPRIICAKDKDHLKELVDGLNAIGASPRDMISILRTLKAAGALHAELEVY